MCHPAVPFGSVESQTMHIHKFQFMLDFQSANSMRYMFVATIIEHLLLTLNSQPGKSIFGLFYPGY